MTSDVAQGAPSTPVGRRRGRGRRSRFFIVLVTVTTVMHVPVALGVASFARMLGLPVPLVLGWAWATAGVLLFPGRIRAHMPDRHRSSVWVSLVDIPYFIHWCAALWTLIPAAVATVLTLAWCTIQGAPLRLPCDAYAWIYASGLVVCGYGIVIRRRWVRVVERPVVVEGLDPRLEGLRIAHLSDLHIGTFSPRAWGLAWAEKANARDVDLAVVTGDMVTSGTEFHADVADVVASLRARHGVFVAMGNHDYFGDGEPLISQLRDRGVAVLRNDGERLSVCGATIWLAAVDDTWTRRQDMTRAMAARPAGATSILLAHDPTLFDEAVDAGADLVLSGHTHGGQVALPFFYRVVNLAYFAYRYRVGFYRIARSVLYVSPGLGTTGPPMRLGVAPEVTILVLRAPSPV